MVGGVPYLLKENVLCVLGCNRILTAYRELGFGNIKKITIAFAKLKRCKKQKRHFVCEL